MRKKQGQICMSSKKEISHHAQGRVRGLNPGPPPPKGGIIPLDQPDLLITRLKYNYNQLYLKSSLPPSHTDPTHID